MIPFPMMQLLQRSLGVPLFVWAGDQPYRMNRILARWEHVLLARVPRKSSNTRSFGVVAKY